MRAVSQPHEHADVLMTCKWCIVLIACEGCRPSIWCSFCVKDEMKTVHTVVHWILGPCEHRVTCACNHDIGDRAYCYVCREYQVVISREVESIYVTCNDIAGSGTDITSAVAASPSPPESRTAPD